MKKQLFFLLMVLFAFTSIKTNAQTITNCKTESIRANDTTMWFLYYFDSQTAGCPSSYGINCRLLHKLDTTLVRVKLSTKQISTDKAITAYFSKTGESNPYDFNSYTLSINRKTLGIYGNFLSRKYAIVKYDKSQGIISPQISGDVQLVSGGSVFFIGLALVFFLLFIRLPSSLQNELRGWDTAAKLTCVSFIGIILFLDWQTNFHSGWLLTEAGSDYENSPVMLNLYFSSQLYSYLMLGGAGILLLCFVVMFVCITTKFSKFIDYFWSIAIFLFALSTLFAFSHDFVITGVWLAFGVGVRSIVILFTIVPRFIKKYKMQKRLA